MVDATFVDTPKQRNNREDNVIIKKGAVPISLAKNKNKLAQKDRDAWWITKKELEGSWLQESHKRRQETKLINNYFVTNASARDSEELEYQVNEADDIFYVDSA